MKIFIHCLEGKGGKACYIKYDSCTKHGGGNACKQRRKEGGRWQNKK